MSGSFEEDAIKRKTLHRMCTAMPVIRQPDGEFGAWPEELKGATIISIGVPRVERKYAYEGFGLLIDYRPAGSSATKRVVLGFNELGLWIELNEEMGDDAAQR